MTHTEKELHTRRQTHTTEALIRRIVALTATLPASERDGICEICRLILGTEDE